MRSSADPTKTSATIKFFLLGVITWLAADGAQLMGIMCEIGSYCYPIEPDLIDQLKHIVDLVAQGAFYALTLVSVLGSLWAAGRKLIRTFTGQNLAIK